MEFVDSVFITVQWVKLPGGSTMATRLNIPERMKHLSLQTQVAYQRWIIRWLADTYQINRRTVDLDSIRLDILTAALRPEHLRNWLKQLHQLNMSRSTIAQARAAVMWVAQHLAETNHTDYTVPGALSRIETPSAREGEQHRTWLSKEQVQKVLEALVNVEGKPALRARNLAMVVLMVTCGLRREELAAARWKDIHQEVDKSMMQVHGKANKERVIELPTIAVQTLEGWKKFHPMPQGENYIFVTLKPDGTPLPDRLSGHTIFMIIKEAGARAGLEVPISPHDLRRSYARLAYEAGMDYEQLRLSLGHESAGTTQRYLGDSPRRP